MSCVKEFIFDSIEDSIDAFRRGEIVVVMDDETRENEGDMIMAAEFATAEKVTMFIRHTSGILCVPMKKERAVHLNLPPMLVNNTDPKQTAFTVSCDVVGTTTGVSAYDRALTTKALSSPDASANMFRKPGHIFPLVAKPGGVLERRGHTEATIDLCEFAGVTPVGLIGEITNDDGTMSRLPECYAFAKQNGLRITSVEAIANYKRSLGENVHTEEKHANNTEEVSEVELLAECELPLKRADKYLGMWTLRCYRSFRDGLTRHAVLIKGDISQLKNSNNPVYTRIHSECFTSHVLGSQRCDCSQQLDVSLEMINNRGSGVAIYVDGHEGRGIGLHNKIKAYSLQHNQLLDTYEANAELGLPLDARKYDAPKAILKHLGISKVALMTNNPLKLASFKDIVVERVPVLCDATEHNSSYLQAKRLFEKKHAVEVPITTAKEFPIQKEIPIQIPNLESIATLRFGIIRTSWNETLVNSLSNQCKESLLKAGVKDDNIIIRDVPGSFEIPFAAQRLARTGQVDAIICFGVLLKGETMHFEHISSSVANGLMQVQLSTDIPVINGVLNCLTIEQAATRCAENSPLPLSLATTAIRMAYMYTVDDPCDKNHERKLTFSVPVLQPCTQ